METYDLIVVGGGPGGSTAASIAARSGLSVLLLEADTHPRPHVGESLLPGIVPILEKMGALADIEAAGFTRKTGSTHWGWGQTPEWDLWFRDSEEYPYAWLVDRSRFDEALFRAAARSGVHAHEGTPVRSFVWENDRVVGVTFRRRGAHDVQEARAPVTLDASGQAMLLARELGLRELIPGLQNEASWAHFEGAGRLPAPRSEQALFIANESSWMWHFPLSATRTSVGIIRLQDDGGETTAAGRESAFDESVAACARLQAVLGSGARRVTPVRTQRDWSYRMKRLAGPGWMLVGDASGFIDPVLSTGVQLAMHAGYHAATLIALQRQGERTEQQVHDAYEKQHRALFEDMLRIVRYFYRTNLRRDEYFWESKRILVDAQQDISPRKAFMVLTSGLARNLAFDERSAETAARREAAAGSGAPLDDGEVTSLRYVCIHMRWNIEPAASLYFLIEPAEPASPTLFATRNWHLNCLAPRLGKDVLRVPGLGAHIQALGKRIRDLDVHVGEPLSHFWTRVCADVAETVRALPSPIELVRVFGE